MPPEPAFTLRPMARADAERVRRLWSRRFGGDRDTQTNWIAAALDRDHPVAAFVADVGSEPEPVGFTFLDVASPEHTREYLGLDALGLTPEVEAQNGIFHLSCVARGWEGHGIGSAFYRRRLQILAERGVDRAFGISWHRPNGTHDSRSLFEKWGFTPFATIDRYYQKADSRPHCPACEGACTCTASLYVRITPNM